MTVATLMLWVVLPLNLWLMCGCAMLFLAVDRTIVATPASLIQSLVWMACWPVLAIMGLRVLFLESAAGKRRGIA